MTLFRQHYYYIQIIRRKISETKKQAPCLKVNEWEGRKLNLVHFIKKLKFYHFSTGKCYLLNHVQKTPVSKITKMKILITTYSK